MRLFEGRFEKGDAPKEKRPRQNRRRLVEFPQTRELVYFFFLAGAFLVAFLAAFLVAFFIERFSLNVKFAIYIDRSVIHI